MREKILQNKSCYLSSLQHTDLEQIRVWRNIQMAILRQYKPLTEKNQEDWWNSLAADTKTILFTIISSQSDDLIGYCGLTNVDFQNSRAEVSFLTKYANDAITEYRQTFLETLNMLCIFAFRKLKLNRLFTETFEFRKDHIKILEEFGFIKEGVLREHVFKEGSFTNSEIHSILRREFENGE
jgi:RimJ/RimL family protein N-acetyltransferase